jgi:hypothetical protein
MQESGGEIFFLEHKLCGRGQCRAISHHLLQCGKISVSMKESHSGKSARKQE